MQGVPFGLFLGRLHQPMVGHAQRLHPDDFGVLSTTSPLLLTSYFPSDSPEDTLVRERMLRWAVLSHELMYKQAMQDEDLSDLLQCGAPGGGGAQGPGSPALQGSSGLGPGPLHTSHIWHKARWTRVAAACLFPSLRCLSFNGFAVRHEEVWVQHWHMSTRRFLFVTCTACTLWLRCTTFCKELHLSSSLHGRLAVRRTLLLP